MHWTFWLLAFVLVLVTLLWPLYALQRRREARHGTEEVNLAIYRERLDELKQDLRNGTIEQSQFDEAKDELASALLHDLKADEHKRGDSAGTRWAHWAVIGSIAMGVPVLSLVVFAYLSDRIHFVTTPPAGNTTEARQAVSESRQLLAQIQQNPGEAQLWAELGARYMQMQRPYEARQAYQRARQMGYENPDLLIRLAHAIGQTRNGDLSGEPGKLIQRALALDPEHRPALIWAGLLNFQKGDFEAALTYWKQVQEGMPAEAPQRRMLERLIAQAQQRLGGSAPAASASPPPAQAPGAQVSLKVSVKLDPALADQVKPADTLFILARAADGPPMPLAVVRRQAGDLPLQVTLDDSQAMTEQMRLSSFDEVVVVARISPSGQAMPRPGDVYGESAPLTLADTEQVELTLGKVVKEQ